MAPRARHRVGDQILGIRPIAGQPQCGAKEIGQQLEHGPLEPLPVRGVPAGVERTQTRLVRRHLIPAVDRVGAYTWTSIRNDAGGR